MSLKTFIDLFAGIGGFHEALSSLGGTCLLACDNNAQAKQTYLANHKTSTYVFHDDITTLTAKQIPDFDILCAGFPCQPFSNAGKQLGFNDTRGTLFFEVERILKEKTPNAFILENVRGLLTHDSGKTFKVIEQAIKNLGYSFFYKVLKASDYGVPQHRPRLYMVGFKDTTIDFTFPKPIPLTTTMSTILGGTCDVRIGKTLRVGGRNSPFEDRHNWDGYKVNGNWQRLTVKQAAQMQGLPTTFLFPVTDAQAMKQLGNSVAVPVVKAIYQQMLNIDQPKTTNE